MGIIHFLNVKNGDCSLIEHSSKHNTIIDISNGNEEADTSAIFENLQGNHNQKSYPVNPIDYLKDRKVEGIFRFILTHPDMDHMDGIKELFSQFNVINFWDTENTKEMDSDTKWVNFKKEDWDFYQSIRESKSNPKTIHLYSGSKGVYYNQDEDGKSGADGLYILAPTKELVDEANRTGDYNDCSYVILYKTENNKKIIFAGDSADKTWDYILEHHKEDVTNVDILVAPHHGRKSGGNDEYLDTLNPKLTWFGYAKSDDLDYASWNNRGLAHITNNQANCIIADTDGTDGIDIYVTYEIFAKKENPNTFYSEKFKAWYIMTI